MVQRIFIIVFASIMFVACTGLETDKISDEVRYKPNVSLPLGYMTLNYDSPVDLPVDLPDPIESEPISWVEQDTVTFDVEASFVEREYIISMLLQFDITNRYPAELDIEMFFVDDNGTNIYLTETPIKVEPAEIDGSGTVTREMHSDPYPVQIPLTDAQIDLLMQSRDFVIRGSVNDLVITSEIFGNFDTYDMFTAVGVQAQIDISINDK